MSKDISLECVETLNAVQIFDGGSGVEDILSRLEKEVRAMPTDPTTEKGRKEIKSLAYKVARSKTALDDLGKQVQAEAKAKVDMVNAGRRVIVSRLDALRDEVRKPVDEYEAREEKRVSEHRGRIADIQQLAAEAERAPLPVLRQYLAELEPQESHDFEEFQSQANMEIGRTRTQINAAIVLAEHAERERVEQERLAALAAEEERLRIEKERIEREVRIAEEAAAKAKKDAEEAAERERIRAAQKAEEEKAAIERERVAAVEREEKAKRDAAEALERAEREKALAAKRAEEERLQAIEQERKRVAEEKARAEEEVRMREANLEHRRKINSAAVDALIDGGIDRDAAEKAMTLIIRRKVPAVSVQY